MISRYSIDPGARSKTSRTNTIFCAQPALDDRGQPPYYCQWRFEGHPDESVPDVKRAAMNRGWKDTRDHGMVCPGCFKELDATRDKSRGNGKSDE